MKWLLLLVVAAGVQGQTAQVDFVSEGVIDAPVAEVWEVFSTSEGYKKLGPALAEVDLRLGGLIRSRYSADGPLGDDQTIENEILAFEAPRMIAIRIHKPPKTFPFKQAWKAPWTVMTLTEVAPNRTHLRVASMGYGKDDESKAMRQFFEHGNQETVETLQKAFAK